MLHVAEFSGGILHDILQIVLSLCMHIAVLQIRVLHVCVLHGFASL